MEKIKKGQKKRRIADERNILGSFLRVVEHLEFDELEEQLLKRLDAVSNHGRQRCRLFDFLLRQTLGGLYGFDGAIGRVPRMAGLVAGGRRILRCGSWCMWRRLQ